MVERDLSELKAAILDAQIEAVFQGHDIGPFEEVENGFMAWCRKCNQTTWVGDNGLRYSLLEERCPSNQKKY